MRKEKEDLLVELGKECNGVKEEMIEDVIKYLQEKDEEISVRKREYTEYPSSMEIMMNEEPLIGFNTFKKVFGRMYRDSGFYDSYYMENLYRVVEEKLEKIGELREELYDTELLKTKPYKFAIEYAKSIEKEYGYNQVSKIYYRIVNLLAVSTKQKRKGLLDEIEQVNKQTQEEIDEQNRQIDIAQKYIKKEKERYNKDSEKYKEWKEYFKSLGYEEAQMQIGDVS